MFVTFGFAAIIIAVKFLVVIYLLASGLAGWADSHAAFQDGHRLNVAPWGEDFCVRNFIAENELAICISTSVIAAALANLRPVTRGNEP